MMAADHLAEVVESSTCRFVAEARREAPLPAFGAWVRVPTAQSGEVLAVVSSIEMGSIEPGRRAVALGRTGDELRREMPHVFELLRTTFTAEVLAHRTPEGRLRQTLPSYPPAIHDFVYACPDDKVCTLAEPYDYLRTLIRGCAPEVPIDDLVVAVVGRLVEASAPSEREARTVAACRALSRLMNDDHERLQSILRRL